MRFLGCSTLGRLARHQWPLALRAWPHERAEAQPVPAPRSAEAEAPGSIIVRNLAEPLLQPRLSPLLVAR